MLELSKEDWRQVMDAVCFWGSNLQKIIASFSRSSEFRVCDEYTVPYGQNGLVRLRLTAIEWRRTYGDALQSERGWIENGGVLLDHTPPPLRSKQVLILTFTMIDAG